MIFRPLRPLFRWHSKIPKAFKQLARQTATPGGWVAADIGNYGSGVLNAAKLLAGSLPGDGSMTKALLAADVFENNSSSNSEELLSITAWNCRTNQRLKH